MTASELHPGVLLASASWDRFSLWGFEVHVSVLVGCIYLAAIYLFAIGPAREKYGWAADPVSRWRKTSYLGAVALIFFSLNGPLHTLSDQYLFSAHMVQHMLLMLVMPPFLILGIPPWLIRKALEKPWVARTARVLTNPVVAYLAYNVTFIGWHVPQMYNWALVSHDLHVLQHLMFMAVAVMMWWPVVNPVPELERIPTGPLLMMYVFAFGIPSTLVSAFITLSDSVFYPWYELAPRITSLSPLEDQRLGGLIMWIPGMLIFWVGISAVFFRWTKDEYASWGHGKGRNALACLILFFASAAGPVAAQDTAAAPTQDGKSAPVQDSTTSSVEWNLDAEAGASFFFGAKEQATIATTLGVGRHSEEYQVDTEISFLYGEATDADGDSFVNKRMWEVEANVDYQGFSWVNPYVFGSALSSLQRGIKSRFKFGAGGIFTILDSEVTQLDLRLAMLGEQTNEANGATGEQDFLGRWTGQVSFRRTFSEERTVLEAALDYNPGVREFADFTFEVQSSLAFEVTEILSLKLSVKDNYDNGAKERGALSNNDGQLLFSVLASF